MLLIARGHYEVIITEVGAGNVPCFDPGSSLAVRHAGLCGDCWSRPTGQAARHRELGRGQRGGAGPARAQCKMTRNGMDLHAAVKVLSGADSAVWGTTTRGPLFKYVASIKITPITVILVHF